MKTTHANRLPSESCHTIRALLLVVCLFAISCSSTHHRPAYIPKDLDDAHNQLRELLPAQELQRIQAMKCEDEMIYYHMNTGLWLRNNWGLWHGSRLSRYFEGLGVHHPDDMSGIILETFWCKLHEKPFRIEERVEYYQEYWKSQEEPKGSSPKDGARIAWVISQGSGKGTLHLGISTSDLSYWRYEYGSEKGIEPATEADRKDLDELRETWKRIGTKIEDVLRE